MAQEMGARLGECAVLFGQVPVEQSQLNAGIFSVKHQRVRSRGALARWPCSGLLSKADIPFHRQPALDAGQGFVCPGFGKRQIFAG